MKIIPKYQYGSSFFNVWEPKQKKAEKAESAPTKTAKKDDEIGIKDLMKLLEKGEGLDNEMSEITTFFRNMLIEQDLGLSDVSDMNTYYLLGILKINEAKNNKKLWDSTYNQAKNKGTLRDIPITPDGYIIVLDKLGLLQRVTPEVYALKKDSGEFYSINNSMLLNARNKSKAYAHNNELFLTIENSVSLDDVHKQIKDRADLKGNNTTDSFYYDSILNSAPSEEVLQGLALLIGKTAMGPLGPYKIKTTKKGLDMSNEEDEAKVQAAVKYIWESLPLNSRIRLMVETEHGTEGEALYEIAKYLLTGIELENSFDITYAGSRSGSSGSGGGEGGELEDDGTKARWLMEMQQGRAGMHETVTLNLGDQAEARMQGTRYAFMNTKGETIRGLGQPLDQILLDTGIMNITNERGIYFGDQLLRPLDVHLVMLDSSQCTRVLMPFAYGEGGTKHPDFEYLDEFSKATEAVNSKLGSNYTDVDLLKEVAQEIKDNPDKYPKCQALLNAYGELNPNQLCAFLVVDGIGSDDIPSLRENGKKSKLIATKGEHDPVAHQYDALYKSEGFDRLSNGWEAAWGKIFHTFDQLYKSTVFIPINQARGPAIMGTGQQNVKEFNMTNINTQDLAWLFKLGIQSTDSDVLTWRSNP